MATSVAGGMWWVAGQHNLAAYWGGGLGFNDTSIILNGSYDDQVGSFAQGRTAFLHQGNWVDPNLKQLGVTFRIGYAPHAFLSSIATTPEGHEYMVNQAGMIPAFKSVTLKPTGQLSQELMAANAKGGNYGVFFGVPPDGAGHNVFGPIIDLFAQNPDNLDKLIADMKRAVANHPKR